MIYFMCRFLLGILFLSLIGCGAGSYPLGGQAYGLEPGDQVILKNIQGEELLVEGVGPFQFTTLHKADTEYSVEIIQKPEHLGCHIANARGTMPNGEMKILVLTCWRITNPLGGRANGLEPGDQIVLKNTQAEELLVENNGPFQFTTPHKADTEYSIEIIQKPDHLDCDITNGQGIMPRAEMTGLELTCWRIKYHLEGKIFGITGNTTIRFSNGEQLSFSQDTHFKTQALFPAGKTYQVEIVDQPHDQTCAIMNHRNEVTKGSKADIRILCQTYTVETPTIYSVYPEPAWPGALVKVTGSGLDRSSLIINGESITPSYQDNAEIQFLVPDLEEGSHNVSVINAGGQDSTTLSIPTIYKGSQVTGNSDHHCLLNPDQQVLCWGDGDLLGRSERIYSSTPVPVEGLPPVKKIEAGSNHTCALTNEGAVWCWGSNSGMLGAFPRVDENGVLLQQAPFTPVKVPDLPKAIDLVSGYSTACILADTGLVHCWGGDMSGQLGNSVGRKENPELGIRAPVDYLSDVVKLSGNGETFCAVTNIGEVRCWGNNPYGEVGNIRYEIAYASVSVSVPPAVDVASTSLMGCSLTRAGDVYCWGFIPFQIVKMDIENVSDIEATDYGVVCARQQESVFCWSHSRELIRQQNRFQGGKMFGSSDLICAANDQPVVECIRQYIQPNPIDYSTYLSPDTPVAVTGLRAKAIAVSSKASCAILLNGEVACWGDNSAYQLGNGSTVGSDHPVIVENVSNARSLYVTSHRACAVTEDNEIFCWDGAVTHAGGIQGHAMVRANDRTIVTLNGSGTSYCATRTDHTAWCGGGSPLADYNLVTEYKAFAPALYADSTPGPIVENCALTLAGTVVCGSANGEPSTKYPLGHTTLDWLGQVTSLTLGSVHACALDPSKKARCWKLGSDQLFEVETSDLIDIHANGDFTTAIDAERNVYQWELERKMSGYVMKPPTQLPGFQEAHSVSHYLKGTCMINKLGAVSCSRYLRRFLPVVIE